MNLNTIDLALHILAVLKFKLLLCRIEAFAAAAITFISSYLKKKVKVKAPNGFITYNASSVI